MTKPTATAAAAPIVDADEAQELLRGSAALEIDLVDALVEREPLPEELAPDEESRCKYLSKKCLRQRAIKAKGERHKLCTFHRAKAIVNQRRLEIRKRGRVAIEGEEPAAVVVVKEVATSITRTSTRRSTSAIQSDKPKAKTTRKRSLQTTVMLPAINVNDVVVASPKRVCPERRTLSPRDIHDIEPFRTPATLYPEDIEALRGLVDLDISTAEPCAWIFQV